MKKAKHDSKKRKIIAVALVLSVLVVTSWIAFLPLIAGTLHLGNSSSSLEQSKNFLSKITLSGLEVFNASKDMGCSSHSVGIQTRISCYTVTTKINQSEKNLAEDLKMLDEQLRNSGFERILSQGKANVDFEEALSGTESVSLRYQEKANSRTVLSLVYYKKGGDYDLPEGTISKADQSKLTPGQYFYGLQYKSSYYACEPLFFEPCLMQPKM